MSYFVTWVVYGRKSDVKPAHRRIYVIHLDKFKGATLRFRNTICFLFCSFVLSVMHATHEKYRIGGRTCTHTQSAISIHLMAVWSLFSQHATAAWEPEGSHSTAESLGLILCIIKHSAASQRCSYTSSTLNKHNDDIRCNSR